MNKLNRKISIVSLMSLFLLVGCTGGKKYYRVKNHHPRHSTLGFSIEPPPGKDWYETKKGNSLLYLKKTDPNKYSLQTKATEIIFSKSFQLKDQFIEFIREKKAKTLIGRKYKNAKLDYSIDNKHSTLCIKYDYSYEDHSYKNLKNNEFVIIKNSGLICKHPEIETNGIELSYKEKTLSNIYHQSYLNEGEIFINSLAFHDAIN